MATLRLLEDAQSVGRGAKKCTVRDILTFWRNGNQGKPIISRLSVVQFAFIHHKKQLFSVQGNQGSDCQKQELCGCSKRCANAWNGRFSVITERMWFVFALRLCPLTSVWSAVHSHMSPWSAGAARSRCRPSPCKNPGPRFHSKWHRNNNSGGSHCSEWQVPWKWCNPLSRTGDLCTGRES